MPAALKASWEVNAGVIPGTPIPEFTKQWHYTSQHFEEDARHAEEPAYQPIFMKMLAEATAYQCQLTDPRRLNWVRLTFLWW